MVFCGSTVESTKENNTANWAKYKTSKTFFKCLLLYFTFNSALSNYQSTSGTCNLDLKLPLGSIKHKYMPTKDYVDSDGFNQGRKFSQSLLENDQKLVRIPKTDQ